MKVSGKVTATTIRTNRRLVYRQPVERVARKAA